MNWTYGLHSAKVLLKLLNDKAQQYSCGNEQSQNYNDYSKNTSVSYCTLNLQLSELNCKRCYLLLFIYVLTDIIIQVTP